MRPLLLTFLVLLQPFTQIVNPEAVTRSFSKIHLSQMLSNGLTGNQSPNATDVEKLKQSDWYATVMKNMHEAEYRFSKVGDSYSTPNRKNNLRFYYDENGFTVQPRRIQIPVGDDDITVTPDQVKYKTLPDWKVAFNLDKKQIGTGTWEVVGSKAEYKTENVTVQYINNEAGMRQNFIVQKPLSGEENLKLNFSVETDLKQRLSSDRLQFVHEQSGVVLNYEQLKVWDANGRILAAGFEKNKNDYAIHVHTAGAVYPITIDPISTTAVAMVESNQTNAQVGYSVASAGDVNGDGYSDVIVGALMYDNGETDEGGAFIYHGSAAGISTTATTMVESNQISARMGSSVASAGDVNKDGYSDVIVGAYLYDSGESDEGAAFVYLGSASGINTTVATVLENNQAGANTGFSVAGAGDVNGDGYSDVIVGARNYDNDQTDEGAAFVYHGSVTGISATQAAMVESNQALARMGFSVAGAGDVNGDGYSDVIVGAWQYNNPENDEGAAFVYQGSATGINPIAAAMMEGNVTQMALGTSVAGAGDVNGDGYSDVVVGAYGYEVLNGAAFVYHGSATGVNTTAAALIKSDKPDAFMGISVAGAGDVNGDGYSDIIVGAYQYSNGENREGAAFVYHGSTTGIDTNAVAMLEGNQANAQMGNSVASAGDVNGDGYSDLIIGANYYDNGETDEGAAFTYHGSATGVRIIAAAMTERNQAFGQMGWSVAGAGDVNGDGYGDVIVGAWKYDNGESDEGAAFVYHGSAMGVSTTAAAILEGNQASAGMGYSVACAGDVNGDGYSDVIAAAVLYTNGEAAEGAAFVYHGSATGINSTAAAMVESNQANANMGYSVAGAGDVNGDGYSDIIVGAMLYDNGESDEGVAFVYHGSATGINNTAASMVESNQGNSFMGRSVAGAGDVNGDGYSDVIVGAFVYSNGQSSEGAAFIYHGSATGINMTAAGTLESNQQNAQMGISVAGAGDVNGDGYSDVIVGAIFYSSGPMTRGGAFICHGSATGINVVAPTIVESNPGGAAMGISVAGAGDVNGDGYSDVIVGASDYTNGPQVLEGGAFVYHGSMTGINTVAAVILESNQSEASMGWSVAGAGDVNGDGYSDVIVGAWKYDSGQFNEGVAFVYHGNAATTSNRNNLKLYNVDLTTPINSSNFPNSDFATGLYVKSFLGRGRGRLVWETKVSYEPYSGNPITNSVLYTSRQSGYTDLTLTGTELTSLVSKQSAKYTKVRARVQYDPVTAITGQMYGPWRYVPSLTTGTGGALPVDLISFKVAWQQQGQTARVNFVTENESEICCYEVEKSDNGFHFNMIGHLDARNAPELHTYNFIDLQATGKKQYYRLKIIHATGETDYSRIVLLQDKTVTEILVFPNPTADVLQLQLNKAYSNIQVQVVNSEGRVVKQLAASSDASQSIKIPVGNLVTGSYFLYLQTGGEKQALQFIKQ